MPKADDKTEEVLSKNHSSVILNMAIAANADGTGIKQFLSAGDAEVAIWERLWEKHKGNSAMLSYDLLQTPHHNSWHSLSYDSWSDLHEKAKVSPSARSALSQIRPAGTIVSSSDAIHDDDNDPPCYGAKLEYQKISQAASGKFLCTGEYPKSTDLAPMEFLISPKGVELLSADQKGKSLLRSGIAAGGLTFPDKPVVPNKSSGFA
jgi:hypothetical protein